MSYEHYLTQIPPPEPKDVLREVMNDSAITESVIVSEGLIGKTLINLILKGDRPITDQTAVKLAKVIPGTTAKFWSYLRVNRKIYEIEN